MPPIPPRPALLLAVLVAGGSAHGLRAQTRPNALSVEMSLRGTVFDNFFRVSDEAAARQIGALQVSGSLVATVDSARRSTVSFGGSVVDYSSLGPSPGILGRFRSPGGTHAYDAMAGYQWSRPAYEVGDLLERADIARLRAGYSYRPGSAVQLGLAGTLNHFAFEESPVNDGLLARIEGSVRFRGFGYRLSPEVGATYGTRSNDDGYQDFRERDLFARIVSVPVPWLWTSLRYRHRTRSYEVTDRTAPNFGREDRHGQWTLAAAADVTRRTRLNVYYDYLDADSDRPVRIFTSQMLTLGMTWRY